MSNSINTPSAFAEGQEETIINAELKQKVNTEAVLNSELTQSWISNDKLDAEQKQVVKSDSYLESELKQSWISNDKLEDQLYVDKYSVYTENSYLNAEINLHSSRYNKINAKGEVVAIVNPTVKVYSNNDTFVRENEPFINYYNSQSLKSGIYNGEKYAAYIKFEDLINQNNVVNKNILSAKIVFKTLSSNTSP